MTERCKPEYTGFAAEVHEKLRQAAEEFARQRADDAISRAYVEAHKIAEQGVIGVAIHVSTEIADHLRSRATLPAESRVETMFGFPLVVEENARPDHVSVRTITVIS